VPLIIRFGYGVRLDKDLRQSQLTIEPVANRIHDAVDSAGSLFFIFNENDPRSVLVPVIRVQHLSVVSLAVYGHEVDRFVFRQILVQNFRQRHRPYPAIIGGPAAVTGPISVSVNARQLLAAVE